MFYFCNIICVCPYYIYIWSRENSESPTSSNSLYSLFLSERTDYNENDLFVGTWQIFSYLMHLHISALFIQAQTSMRTGKYREIRVLLQIIYCAAGIEHSKLEVVLRWSNYERNSKGLLYNCARVLRATATLLKWIDNNYPQPSHALKKLYAFLPYYW